MSATAPLGALYIAASDCRIALFSIAYFSAVVCSRPRRASAGDSLCDFLLGFNVCECPPGGVPRLLSGHPLPTLDCSVHIERIDLDAVTVPAALTR
jgi:hypothetical protein